MDRISPTQRPHERPIGFQRWSNLTFLHWRVPADVLRPLLPSNLQLDLHDGVAWLGLVPFYMSGVRPFWAPAVPGISNFCETNLRTYVHLDGANPGVWFFSLDAAQKLAVWIARTKWCLNYFHARMQIDRVANGFHYRSQRLDGSAQVDVEIELEQPTSDLTAGCHFAERDSFEFFLAERYFLYSTDRAGRLYRGQVHHSPYPLRPARLLQCHQTVSLASGIELSGSAEHVLFSPGVTVDIFPLRPVVS